MTKGRDVDGETLKEKLRILEAAKDKEARAAGWLEGLPSRKRDEIEHHNVQRDETLTKTLPSDTFEMLHGNKKFYQTIEKSDQYLRNWIRTRAAGKIFLDFACGNGNQVIQAAKEGAELSIGIDLSDISIRNARRAAKEAGVAETCVFIQGDCENTGLPENSIDVVLCSGVLHHMDLSAAFPELRRILKPGGVALALEALDYNPVIKLYRRLTPHMRTEWEKHHILSMNEVRFAGRFFKVREVKFWHLFSIAAAYLRRRERLFQTALNWFNRLDSIALRLPGLQLMAWQFTFEMHKEPVK